MEIPVKKLPERHLNALLLLVILGLFVTFNKGALQSYFSDDDFSNLLAIFLSWKFLLKAVFTPALLPNFRPLGAMFYKAMDSFKGLHFGAYVAILQTFHIATGLLLWLFLRRLGLRPLPAALGCAFFTLHISSLPAYWQPMYIFDVLCGFWVILALLLYQRSRFVLSLLCAWLAFKSKEIEVMLPMVLLVYEWYFGRENNSGRLRWKPLLPYFLMSLSFGLQSLMIPRIPETAYTIHLSAACLLSGITYYGGRLLYAPLSGLIISIGLLLLKLRMVTCGVIGFWILMSTMFGFPGVRQCGAYLYVPLLLFALAVAGVAQGKPRWAVFFTILWIPASYNELRTARKPLIAYHYDHIPYVNQILESLAAHPAPTAVVYDGTLNEFNDYGQKGLFRFALARYDLPVYAASEPEARDTIRRPGAVLFSWDHLHHQLRTSTFPGDGREMSHVDFGKDNPFWQLKNGWMPLSGDCRWTAPRSVITLRQPVGDAYFSMRVNLAPGQAERLHQVLHVSSGGQVIAEHHFIKSGFQILNWPVFSDSESIKDFDISVDPAFYPAKSDGLGVIICECGFLLHAQEPNR